MSIHGVARQSADAAGGTQLAGGQSHVTIDGHLVVVLGDPVAGHGADEHASPVMAEGSSHVSITGIPVCREGHVATCGHPTTGASHVSIDE